MSNQYFILFTKNGLINFQKEYDDLLLARPKVVEELSTARDMGDRSENAAYKYARRKLSQTDSRLSFLKRIIEHAKVVTPANADTVSIGCTVIVEVNGKETDYTLVGEYESDPMKGYISYRSPVGKALSGKKIGEKVILELPIGPVEYKILSITI